MSICSITVATGSSPALSLIPTWGCSWQLRPGPYFKWPRWAQLSRAEQSWANLWRSRNLWVRCVYKTLIAGKGFAAAQRACYTWPRKTCLPMLLVLFPWSCIWPCSNTETRILCFSIFALSSSRLGIACKSNQVMVWDDSVTIKLRVSNYASATTLQQPKPTLASATKPQQPRLAYQNPTPSGKYMQSHILHVISTSHPLWQVHAQSHLTRHIIWFLNHSLRSIVYGSWFTKHSLRVIVCESWFTKHSLRILVLLELFDLTALHFVQGFFFGAEIVWMRHLALVGKDWQGVNCRGATGYPRNASGDHDCIVLWNRAIGEER